MSTLSPPTPADYAANRGPEVVAGNLVGAILATISVALRFASRLVSGRYYGLDDVLILFALFMGWGSCVTAIIMVHYGFGRHLNTLEPAHDSDVLAASKAYYASQIIWTCAVLSVKLSILVLYNGLFGKLRYFKLTSWGLGIFTIMWAITTLFVIIFQCSPVSYAWNKDENGSCINAGLYFIIGSALDVAVDVAIFVLPMYAVWHLQLSTVKRVLLLITFGVGSLSVVFGIIRLAFMAANISNPDWTWADAYICLWSTLEPCLGITAICLSTLRPLWRWVMRKYRHWTGRSTNVSGNVTSSQQSSGLRSNGSNTARFKPSAPQRPVSSLGGSTIGSEVDGERDKVSDNGTNGDAEP